jgi:hypothetical protein
MRERGNVLSGDNQNRELQSFYPMYWGWGGVTNRSMLHTTKWASNLDGNFGNCLRDQRRDAIEKQECMGSVQRKLIGNSIRDLQSMSWNLAGAQHIGWVTMNQIKLYAYIIDVYNVSLKITVLPSSNENSHLLRLCMEEVTTTALELQRQALTECWRKICHEGIRNCCCLINIVTMKS